MPHANYALNYTFKKSIPSKWRDQRVLADIWTSIDSGCSSKADIGALEMFVYNLAYLNISFNAYNITCQLKRKLDGKSTANFFFLDEPCPVNLDAYAETSYTRLSRSKEHNFPQQIPYVPPIYT